MAGPAADGQARLAGLRRPRSPPPTIPKPAADIEPTAPHLARLAYDELLASQLALALMRAHQRRSAGKRARAATAGCARRSSPPCPSRLTGSQEAALAEIDADLARPERMLRLLQGDVGSGKTVVALLAAASSSRPAPRRRSWRRPNCSSASTPAPSRRSPRRPASASPSSPAASAAASATPIVAGLADGSIDLLVGTHALFQAGVAFRDLGLVVVDEQHRFGVHQRLALTAKGGATDVLVMTATPIPRTLVLTYYGDMDVSRLTEKPAGRRPIETRAIPLDPPRRGGRARPRRDRRRRQGLLGLPAGRGVGGARRRRRRGALRRAHRGARRRRRPRPRPHEAGRPRRARWRGSSAGETKVLVATTVVEVGVDVPDATIMVIEHAERFGLAQLHQLRGRVGRSDRPSVCLLLYKAPLGEVARDRLTDHARDRGRLRHRRGGPAAARRRRNSRHPPVRHARLPHRQTSSITRR